MRNCCLLKRVSVPVKNFISLGKTQSKQLFFEWVVVTEVADYLRPPIPRESNRQHFQSNDSLHRKGEKLDYILLRDIEDPVVVNFLLVQKNHYFQFKCKILRKRDLDQLDGHRQLQNTWIFMRKVLIISGLPVYLVRYGEISLTR